MGGYIVLDVHFPNGISSIYRSGPVSTVLESFRWGTQVLPSFDSPHHVTMTLADACVAYSQLQEAPWRRIQLLYHQIS